MVARANVIEPVAYFLLIFNYYLYSFTLYLLASHACDVSIENQFQMKSEYK